MTASRSRGQALAEFALVFPIFILLLFAVFDIGRAVYAYNSITNAAREGARLAIVNQDSASIAARVSDQAVGVGATTCVVFLNEGLTSTDCAASQSLATTLCTPPAIGCVASVEARTTWTAITPVIGALLGTFTLTARTEVPVELVCPNPAIAAWSTAASCPKQP